MGSQVKADEKYEFHENTFKKAILATAKSTDDEKSSILNIKLIFMHLKSQSKKLDNDVENVLKKLLSTIPAENAGNIIDDIEAIIAVKLDIGINKVLVNYLADVLTDNENDVLRKKSYKILNQNRHLLSEESKNVVENEQLITTKRVSYENFLQHIKNGFKVNVSFFNELDLQTAKTIEIISEIEKREVQKIPKCFVKRYLDFINSLTFKSESLILIASVLIEGGYVTLKFAL
jgi:hypothetical protein